MPTSRYCVPFRRRKEGKTDYKTRKPLLLSGKPRIVVRLSLNNTLVQIIKAKPHGDEVLVAAHSKELSKKHDWRAPSGNLPAAYLTGLLCGLKAQAQGISEVILDIGLNSSTKGARTFATLKGCLDAGIQVPYSEKKLPDEKRIEGKHIELYAENLTSNPEQYSLSFSKYLAQKLPPETISAHFTKVKNEILAKYKKKE